MFSETKTQESTECFKITKLKLHTKVQRTLIPLNFFFLNLIATKSFDFGVHITYLP